MWLYVDGQPPNLVWDRKVEGGFPELKVLVRCNLSLHCEDSPNGELLKRFIRNSASATVSSQANH